MPGSDAEGVVQLLQPVVGREPGDEPSLGVAEEGAMGIRLAGAQQRREPQLLVERIGGEAHAQNAGESSRGIEHGLLHTDLDTALFQWECGIELRPVQVAPQKLAAWNLRRAGVVKVRC